MQKSALIVGAGRGLSASLARLCANNGMKVSLAARNVNKLEKLARETSADLYDCDAADINQVTNLFNNVDSRKTYWIWSFIIPQRD